MTGTSGVSEAADRGRARLMLRLPAFREILQTSNDSDLLDLFELYQAAATALERFRHSSEEPELHLVVEYEDLCRSLEGDVREKISGL